MAQKVALITGGGRGIGAATAILAATQGYDVCVNYERDESRAEAVAESIRAMGRRAMTCQANVAIEEEVEAMFAAIDAEFGRLDALVNSAGTNGRPGRLDALRAKDVRALMQTNIDGTILCCREAIRRMAPSSGGTGGAIVNLSSAAARLGAAGRNVYYAASKGAINSLTFGLAQEVAADEIRVNAVSPGVIDTEMQDPARLESIASKLPMRRIGEPEEVAAAIVWLLSPQASYISGTILDVAGAR